ncbi:RNA-binding protein spenito [Bacillus rossius redtenbacheri]|uniref:RNA-binding protein spenito n=1 Tax=Bacillus rossius redtenbacheri TaxID=93214 RepID=UPI002FDEF38B
MKRSSDRDTPPPRSKRSRSSLGRYDDSSDERITPERIRRRSRGRSPSPRGRYAESSHRDDYGRSRDISDRGYPSYKVLCVSALHPKASDDVIKDTLYREYKKYGDFSIRISHDVDERVAYICFRSSEDARDAKHSKPRVIIYDKVALVEAVYESRSASDLYRRGSSRPRSLTPDYDRYYHQRSRSPGPDRHRPSESRYERSYGPPPGLPHRDFRREGPPPPHHDFLRAPVHHGPPHIPPGPPHHYGPPRHMMPGAFKPHPHFDKFDNKKDKFPNYLHHVPPEDDPLATRTLFAGNLEINITEEELRRIFGRYGVVEDIDIKRPPPGTGNAYAFVRFQNLDMAHRAKVELSGQYIGKFQCKIGFGKATPTTRIWIGGLGPWTSISQLEREFDRFGAIKKIDYVKGDTCAYILYDSIDAAQAAVKEMRGFPLGGPEHRLRADFADVAPFVYKPRPFQDDMGAGGDFRVRVPGRDDFGYDPAYEPWPEADFGYGPPRGGFRGRGMPWHDRRGGGRGMYRPGGYPGDMYMKDEPDWVVRRPPPDAEFEVPRPPRRSGSAEPGVDRSRSHSPRHHSVESDSGSDGRRNGLLGSARTLSELARKCAAVWHGALILKNSLFPAKFHLTDGDADIVESLMKDEEGKHHLRITQRLRLDPPKLEDVSKRIASSSAHAIFIGLSGSTASVTNEDSTVQTRPLRNLVSYLKQKEAAGVISLLNKDTDATGVLYAFPPCAFSTELLKRTAPNLSEEGLKEDHLVIVVVRGGSA